MIRCLVIKTKDCGVIQTMVVSYHKSIIMTIIRCLVINTSISFDQRADVSEFVAAGLAPTLHLHSSPWNLDIGGGGGGGGEAWQQVAEEDL